MGVMKIRINDFTVRAQHRFFPDKNTRAITNEKRVVVDPRPILDFDDGRRTARLDVNISAEVIRRGIDTEIDPAMKLDRALPHELDWLIDCRRALYIFTLRQKPVFQDSCALIEIDEPRLHKFKI